MRTAGGLGTAKVIPRASVLQLGLDATETCARLACFGNINFVMGLVTDRRDGDSRQKAPWLSCVTPMSHWPIAMASR